jgi:hypothetical protein
VTEVATSAVWGMFERNCELRNYQRQFNSTLNVVAANPAAAPRRAVEKAGKKIVCMAVALLFIYIFW